MEETEFTDFRILDVLSSRRVSLHIIPCRKIHSQHDLLKAIFDTVEPELPANYESWDALYDVLYIDPSIPGQAIILAFLDIENLRSFITPEDFKMFLTCLLDACEESRISNDHSAESGYLSSLLVFRDGKMAEFFHAFDDEITTRIKLTR